MGLSGNEKNLSPKLKLICYSSLNSFVKINNDPNSLLLSNYTEIKSILNLDNYSKILNFSKSKVHEILYIKDVFIEIKETMGNDLKTNFYLVLLIRDEIDLINYKFSSNYIKDFNKYKKDENNKFFNIIKSKLIIDLLNNYKNCELDDEDKGGGFVSDLENEKIDCIKKYIKIIKEINQDLEEDDIYEMNIDQLYTHIIKFLIKRNKLRDYDFCYNIVKHLDLENIEIEFLESENLFNQILETLDMKNDFIKKYIITNFEDIQDDNKINTYFILLNYIFKSPIYIYQIPLLFEAHKKIIEFIKTKDFSSLTFSSKIMIERFEFIMKKLSDLGYYYSLYLQKKENLINNDRNKNDDNTKYKIEMDSDNIIFLNDNKTVTIKKEDSKDNNIREEILKQSIFTFDISMAGEKMPVIKNINIIYGNILKIKYDDLLELKAKNNLQNNSGLNKTYSLFCKFLEDFFYKIVENINNQKINCDIQIQLEFKYNSKKGNLDIFYSIPKEKISFQDENILGKNINELNQLNLFIDGIKSFFETNQQETNSKSTTLNSILTATSSNISIDNFESNSNIYSHGNNAKIIKALNQDKKQNDALNDFQIINFIKIIYEHHESVKFFIPLKNDYFLSCSDDKFMILYDQNFNILKRIPNQEDILYYISEKKSQNKKYIELIACYLIHIYLITISLDNNYKYDFRKYEIPKTKILFCKHIDSSYVISGINIAINAMDNIFDYSVAQKKMNRLSNDSYKSGCLIDNNYITLISNSLIPGGNNQLSIFDLKHIKIIYSVSDFSPTITENGIELMELTNNSILLCGCKKYNSFEKNGILIVDVSCLKNENINDINYKFYETHNFEVYCFCQILYKKIKLNNKTTYEKINFFLVGGFCIEKKIGAVKLFKFKNDDCLKIQYLQDIENFYEFEMPVNNITQSEKSGNIIITTIDGKIFLFSEPNINLYLNHKEKYIFL